MRKKHWYLPNGKTACRPATKDVLKRDAALSLDTVTCKPCAAAIGLTPIVFKASAKNAVASILLPSGERAECLCERIEMQIVNTPASKETDDPVGPFGKPEPLRMKLVLTEDGWQALKAAMIVKV